MGLTLTKKMESATMADMADMGNIARCVKSRVRRIDLVFGQDFLSQWRSMGNQCQLSDPQICVQLCGSTSSRSLGREITSWKGPRRLRHGRFQRINLHLECMQAKYAVFDNCVFNMFSTLTNF
jgi:hypothetical protein